MKMAENTLMLTFQNKCETINSNGVEAPSETNGKISNNDITKMETIINKSEDQPNEVLLESTLHLPQEDAVDKVLAGEHKNQFIDELLSPRNFDNDDGDVITFKTDPKLIADDCNDLVFGDVGVEEEVDDEDTEPEELAETVVMVEEKRRRASVANFVAKNLKKRSIKCLNKMQIMEDVREGCNVQPSSPGHAEQRPLDEPKIATDSTTENGYVDDNSSHAITQNQESPEVVSTQIDTKESENLEMKDTESNQYIEESYSNASSANDDSNPTNTASLKRKSNNSSPDDSENAKRLNRNIEENFIARDRILNDFMELSDCNNLDQLHAYSEQTISEINTLNDLVLEKEREWNSILHLKKVKEELLLRIQRRKQILLITTDESQFMDSGSPQSILKMNLTKPVKMKHRHPLSRPMQNNLELNGDLRQARQRPVVDVQSLIADYRQRHPEAVPRRGRRIRNPQQDNKGIALSMANFRGAGGVGSELGMLLNSMNGNRSDASSSTTNLDTLSQSQDTTSFKDMLVQVARLSQSDLNVLKNAIKPPPPYPEVTVHPVPTATAPPTNSLLHGILTKSPSKSNSKSTFSPTLARLLTAPERTNNATSTPNTHMGSNSHNMLHPVNMSISEILSSSKARNEITITPVGSQFENSKPPRDEEETEDGVDQLVIDESVEAIDARKQQGDNTSDAGDSVPQCQGCNENPAKFLCAGCNNQWYCCRDCQISAWDEHCEVCSS